MQDRVSECFVWQAPTSEFAVLASGVLAIQKCTWHRYCNLAELKYRSPTLKVVLNYSPDGERHARRLANDTRTCMLT